MKLTRTILKRQESTWDFESLIHTLKQLEKGMPDASHLSGSFRRLEGQFNFKTVFQILRENWLPLSRSSLHNCYYIRGV